mmetsp:Transcript_44777/g.139306  ORF Transcript_44777/g.139306 Transcript_44777/m.139306 type:complete len:297 (-) Transcript_44777:146-1036(-)
MDRQRRQLTPRVPPPVQHGLDGRRQAVDAPEGEEAHEHERPRVRLGAPHRRVVLRVRRPGVQQRRRGNVLVRAHLVRHRVVLVVLVTPPRGREAREQRSDEAHGVGELVHAVDVVVAQPTALGGGERQGQDREASLPAGKVGKRQPSDEQGTKDRHEPCLVCEVPLPPALGLQPPAQRPEVARHPRDRPQRGLRPLHGARVKLRQPHEHPPRALAVEGVHHLCGVAALVVVDELHAAGVLLLPSGQVVPRVVDAHREGPAAFACTVRPRERRPRRRGYSPQSRTHLLNTGLDLDKG